MKNIRIFFDVDTQNDFMNQQGALYVPDAEQIKPNLGLLTEYAKNNNIPVVGSVDRHFGTEEYKEREGELAIWGGLFPNHCMDRTYGQLKIPETTLWLADGKEADWCTVNGNDHGNYINHCMYHKYPEKPIPKPVAEARKNAGLSEKEIEKDWEELRTGINKYNLKALIKYFKETVEQKVRQGGFYFEKQTYDVFSNPITEYFLRKAKIKEAVVYGVATDFCVKAAVLGMQTRGIQCYLVTDAIKGVFPDKTQQALEEMVAVETKLVTTKQVLEGKF